MSTDYVMYSEAIAARIPDGWGDRDAPPQDDVCEYVEFNCRATLELSDDLHVVGDVISVSHGCQVVIGIRLDDLPSVECFAVSEFERVLIDRLGQTLCMHPVLGNDLNAIKFDLADPAHRYVVWLNFSLERSYLEHG